jgi:ADP-ribose pyrophosphatase YjhB (NUDIX family)
MTVSIHLEGHPMRYCPECARPLDERMSYGRMRPVCPACGYIAFRDPKVSAGAIVTRAGTILLTRRALDPGRGLWALPAGYMEWDERVEDAARREVREETGLDVTLDGLVGVYSQPDRGVVLVVYAATVLGGTLQHDDESEELGYFSPDALPPLAFPNTPAIVADWRAWRRERGSS